jgi:hypothetical protein
MKTYILFAFALASLAAGAATTAPTPHTLLARSAMSKDALAETQAVAAYRKAIIASKRVEVEDLKNAQKDALTNNQLDEAMAIAELVKKTQTEITVWDASSANNSLAGATFSLENSPNAPAN